MSSSSALPAATAAPATTRLPAVIRPGQGPRIQSRAWMVTINNPVLDPTTGSFAGTKDDPRTWDQVQFAAGQLEKGESGTTHLQLYVYFAHNKALTSTPGTGVKKVHPLAHWEVRRGTHEQALTYVTKDESSLGQRFIFGDPPNAPGKTNDSSEFDEVKAKLDEGKTLAEIADCHFSLFLKHHSGLASYIGKKRPARRTWLTKNLVIFGSTGTGKSRFCHDLELLFPGEVYWKSKDKWWGDYNGEPYIVMDEFYGWVPYDELLRMLDRYVFRPEVKGAHIYVQPRAVVFTSNKEPTEWYPNVSDTSALLRRLHVVSRLDEAGKYKVLKKPDNCEDETAFEWVFTHDDAEEDSDAHLLAGPLGEFYRKRKRSRLMSAETLPSSMLESSSSSGFIDNEIMDEEFGVVDLYPPNPTTSAETTPVVDLTTRAEVPPPAPPAPRPPIPLVRIQRSSPTVPPGYEVSPTVPRTPVLPSPPRPCSERAISVLQRHNAFHEAMIATSPEIFLDSDDDFQ